jgi:hypothetical protein
MTIALADISKVLAPTIAVQSCYADRWTQEFLMTGAFGRKVVA